MVKIKSVILSIVIPTKNRYETLTKVLEYLLTIQSEDVEFLIHDNSEDNTIIKTFLAEIDDNRIKYIHTREKLSQSENSHEAVKNASGEFICFIGDDDFVMPYIVDVVKWMKNTNTNIVKGAKPNYYWPGLPSNSISKNYTGVLNFESFTYQRKKVSCTVSLEKTLKKGGVIIDYLPSVYHGIVSKSAMNQILKNTGSYFPGPSPDMASAVSLSLVEEYYTVFDFPIVISGKSSKSIGGSGVLHKHINKLEDVAHLSKDVILNWNESIPKIWTGPTIWAQSLIEALNRNNRTNLQSKLNIDYLNASLFVLDFQNRHVIFTQSLWSLLNFNFFICATQIFTKRTKIFIRNRFLKQNFKSVSNLKTIEAAINEISKTLDSNKISKLLNTSK